MKTFLFSFVLALGCVFSQSCSIAGESVPEPFRSQIERLQRDSIALTEKCQDLQKQQAELQAQISWNNQRLNLVANEALQKTGHVSDGYTVNVGNLKIEKR